MCVVGIILYFRYCSANENGCTTRNTVVFVRRYVILYLVFFSTRTYPSVGFVSKSRHNFNGNQNRRKFRERVSGGFGRSIAIHSNLIRIKNYIRSDRPISADAKPKPLRLEPWRFLNIGSFFYDICVRSETISDNFCPEHGRCMLKMRKLIFVFVSGLFRRHWLKNKMWFITII